jgi:hypothetical protein
MTKDIVPWKCHICKGDFDTPDGGICARCSRATCRDHLHQIGAKKLEATWVCAGCLTSEEKSKSKKFILSTHTLKDRIKLMSFSKLFVLFFISIVACLVLSYLAFYFPIAPLYSYLNLEFSNLGPIATASWGVVFDLFVVTPLFLGLLTYRLIHKRRSQNQ